jgi:hypothetical protein
MQPLEEAGAADHIAGDDEMAVTVSLRPKLLQPPDRPIVAASHLAAKQMLETSLGWTQSIDPPA